MAEFIHCFICFAFPSKDVKFYFASCAHIACFSCVKKGCFTLKCKICNKPNPRVLEINEKLPPEIADLFTPVEVSIRKFNEDMGRLLDFQQMHRDRLVKQLECGSSMLDQLMDCAQKEVKKKDEFKNEVKRQEAWAEEADATIAQLEAEIAAATAQYSSPRPPPRARSRQSTRPRSRESIRLLSRESVRLSSRESVRPMSRESVRPRSRESIRLRSRESTRPMSRESVRPMNRESGRPMSRESARPMSRESVRPMSRESMRPRSRESDRANRRETTLNLTAMTHDPFRTPAPRGGHRSFITSTPLYDTSISAGDRSSFDSSLSFSAATGFPKNNNSSDDLSMLVNRTRSCNLDMCTPGPSWKDTAFKKKGNGVDQEPFPRFHSDQRVKIQRADSRKSKKLTIHSKTDPMPMK